MSAKNSSEAMPSRTLHHAFSPSHQSSPSSYTKHYAQELLVNLLPTIATDIAILATATFVFFFYNWYRKIVQQRGRNNKNTISLSSFTGSSIGTSRELQEGSLRNRGLGKVGLALYIEVFSGMVEK
mgnify:CR=1 FL=1